MGCGMRFPSEPKDSEIDDSWLLKKVTDPTKTCGTCIHMQNWVCYSNELLVNSKHTSEQWEKDMTLEEMKRIRYEKFGEYREEFEKVVKQ